MMESFESRYTNPHETNEYSESFLHKSEKIGQKIDAVESGINKSVKTFANSLDKTHPGLTLELLDIFDYCSDNPQFKGLSESDLWLHSLGVLRDKHPDKIGNIFDNWIKDLINLLTEFKNVKELSEKLRDKLQLYAFVKGFEPSDMDNQDIQIDQINFKPATTSHWGREA